MEKIRASFYASFSAKVLVPVVAVLVALLAVTVWLVNQRLTQQFETEAVRNLATAEAEFQHAQKSRTRNLIQRFRNLRNEPRYRAIFQSGHLPTLNDAIKDLPNDQGVDVALFTAADGQTLVPIPRDPMLPLGEFETNSAAAIGRALQGEASVDTVRVGNHLFDVVSIPVTGGSGALIGALTFGTEIKTADVQELSSLTRSQIVLLDAGKVVVSTIPNPDSQADFAQLFNSGLGVLHASHAVTPMQKVILGTEHFFCASGQFASLNDRSRLGYLLLCSYEQPLQALHSTQEMLLLVSGLGIVLGSVVVGFLVRRATAPLRALSESAEAVGQGDFTRRVVVSSADEVGELGSVFNQMTENLQRSRQQLESAVETLKSTQAQLVQSEKLSGIGEFVAGVAHELNNPLTAVMGFSELLERADTNPHHQRHLEMIRKSAQRCQKIVQSLLSFARRHQPERKLISVNDLVTCAVDFLQYQLRTSNIEVITRLDPALPKTMVDPHQVQQVFFNIINNARQAIEANQSSGRIRVGTETHGDFLRVTFQDNGPGISEKNLSKVFDPFFTTKDVGKGTGLGLSLCYGTIKEHGGSISVSSRLGDGALFVIELPLVGDTSDLLDAPKPGAAATPAVRHEVPAPKGDPPPATLSANSEQASQTSAEAVPASGEGAGKKVLVIDDEDSILQMIRETLAEEGYEVDVARDGEDALHQLGASPYDLALCDWKMPGLNGQQVYERLCASNPALSERMIFLTGDVINEKAQQFLQERKKVCLTKPFSLAEFRAAVGQAVAARGSGKPR